MCLTDLHLQQLQARGLDPELCVRYGLDSSDRLGSDAIVIPYWLDGAVVNRKHRTLIPPKRFCQEAGGQKIFWNWSAITDPALAHLPLIITEGELDAMAAAQAGFQRVISVPDGAPAEAQGEDYSGSKYSYVINALPALSRVKEIILATDSDAPGINLANDLALRLGKARCRWLKYPKGCKDLGDTLVRYGARGIVESMKRAAWWAISGLATMSGLPPFNEPEAFEIGIPDFGLYRVRLSDLCVVSGYTSHGKTAWLTETACRLSISQGWRTAFASFENTPQGDMRKALRRWYHAKPPHLQTPEELALADRWVEDKFLWMTPREDDDVTLAWLLQTMSAAVVRYDAKLLIIDPWNEVQLDRPRDMTQSEYIGNALLMMRKFARKHNVHVIIAAHPAKPLRNKDGKFPIPTLYDVEDSRHWAGKPDLGVILHQDNGNTIVRLAKSRHHLSIGTPGDQLVSYNRESGRFAAVPPEIYRG